jgi:hypothetical protein
MKGTSDIAAHRSGCGGGEQNIFPPQLSSAAGFVCWLAIRIFPETMRLNLFIK